MANLLRAQASNFATNLGIGENAGGIYRPIGVYAGLYSTNLLIYGSANGHVGMYTNLLYGSAGYHTEFCDLHTDLRGCL